MAITIQLTREQEEALKERAQHQGLTAAEYAGVLLERSLRAAPTLSEILAPLRREVEESGVTEEELEALFEEAREEVFQERESHNR